jgi:hypothetical protein
VSVASISTALFVLYSPVNRAHHRGALGVYS